MMYTPALRVYGWIFGSAAVSLRYSSNPVLCVIRAKAHSFFNKDTQALGEE